MTTTNATPVHEFVHKNPAKKDGKFHAAARGLPIPAAIPVVKAKYVIKTLTNGPNSKGIKNVGFNINEPILFGVPFILNPTLTVPSICF